MGALFDIYHATVRTLDFDCWQPNERDKPALVAYFKEHYEGTVSLCGSDDDQTAEALELYERVRDRPLTETKDEIQGHFADMFHCVDDKPEQYYNDPELLRLMDLTIAPLGMREVSR